MTVNDTVSNPEPEREPDVRHALGVTDARTRCGLHLLGRRWTDDPNTPVDCPACRDVLDRADSPLGSSYTPAVLDAIRDTLAAEPTPLEGFADLAPQIGPAPAVERTVTIEVLTDEHSAVGIETHPTATVAIVLRTNGRIAAAPEDDSLWTAPSRKPADILSILLRQARMYADGLDGDVGAELLMPGADVLAALSGQPVGAYTAPLHLRADQVDVGWVACSWATEGDELPVRAVLECEDGTCPWNTADCRVVVAEGVEPVHFAPWQDMTVRIPAAATR